MVKISFLCFALCVFGWLVHRVAPWLIFGQLYAGAFAQLSGLGFDLKPCAFCASALCNFFAFNVFICAFFLFILFFYLPCHFSDKINHVYFNLDTTVQVLIIVVLDMMTMCLFINQYTVFLTCLTGWCFYSDNFIKEQC